MITCNHKNPRLQISFMITENSNHLQVIMVTDYDYPQKK